MLSATILIEDKDLMKILKCEKDTEMDRSSLKFNENKIEIKASDVIAFKATVNGVIKLIETYTNTSKVLK